MKWKPSLLFFSFLGIIGIVFFLNRLVPFNNSEPNPQKEALVKDMSAFQKKVDSGTVPPAELEKEYNVLMQRQQKLAEDEARLGKQLAEEQQKAMNELMANVEAKLKSLQSQIGYDYILSYSKGGGQVLLANDSLDITAQVLQLLNTKEN